MRGRREGNGKGERVGGEGVWRWEEGGGGGGVGGGGGGGVWGGGGEREPGARVVGAGTRGEGKAEGGEGREPPKHFEKPV